MDANVHRAKETTFEVFWQDRILAAALGGRGSGRAGYFSIVARPEPRPPVSGGFVITRAHNDGPRTRMSVGSGALESHTTAPLGPHR